MDMTTRLEERTLGVLREAGLTTEDLVLGMGDPEQSSYIDPLTLVWRCCRSAYGRGYEDAHADPEPLTEGQARVQEREAWARLPL